MEEGGEYEVGGDAADTGFCAQCGREAGARSEESSERAGGCRSCVGRV